MASLTVLSIHNFYRQAGGEDRVFAAEANLLERKGHSVIRYEEHNTRIKAGNVLATGIDAVWSRRSYRDLQSVAHTHLPDVAHFHNTFPLISPAAYYAVGRQSVSVVQTLHNYRLLCVGGDFLRDGRPCEDCLSASPWLGAAHGCYRNSRVASLAVASMLEFHRARQTWTTMVDVFIALSEFARNKFIQGGLPPDRVVVKPNFVDSDPGVGCGAGGYALFVGRLSDEKGVRTLLDASERLPGIPLRIVGQGPLAGLRSLGHVSWAGSQTREQVTAEMKSAWVLVFPSICYESAPLVITEAFATGLPVIASDLGAMADLVKQGCTGLLFRPGDAEDLARQVRWAFAHPEEMKAMRVAARKEFEEKYTAERNYKALIQIYEMAIENFRRVQHRKGKIDRVH